MIRDGRRTDTREKVAELVGERGLDVRSTALILGVTTQTVYRHLKALGIEPPARRRDNDPNLDNEDGVGHARPCKWCGTRHA